MHKRKVQRKSSQRNMKVIALGDSGVGKTSLIQRFVGGFYQDSMTPTIGLDFKIKPMLYQDLRVNLQIWDTAGQEKFQTLTKSYFKGCMGVILVFSLTERSSFNHVQKWLEQLNQHIDEKTVKILVGSKVDCPDERQISVEECAEMALMHDLDYFQVSSKTGYNTSNVFESLVEKYYSQLGYPQAQSPLTKAIKLKTERILSLEAFKCQC